MLAPPQNLAHVLVTGANGFVGAHLTRYLAERGYSVRAAVRQRAPSMTAERVETIRVADLGDAEWSEALSGVQAVVHLAAHVHQTGSIADAAQFTRVNEVGSARLAEQASRAGVRRFVFVSSVKVNGEGTTGKPFSGVDDPAPCSAYGYSKLRAEERLREICAGSRMELVIIRPPLVYGPAVGANFQRLLRLVQQGVPLPFGSVENRRSLVSVWNLVDLIETSLWHPRATGQVWLVSDDEDLSTPELIRRIARAAGRPARLVNVPPRVLLWLGKLLGRGADVQRLTESLQVDVASTCEALGWRPRVSIDEALRRTLAPRSASSDGHA